MSARRFGIGLGLCIAATLLGAVGAVVTGAFWPRAFFHAWLAAWTGWLGLPLGCGVLLMIGLLTGGRWARGIEAPAAAALLTLPLLALLGLPLAFGLPELYPWARERAVSASRVLRHREVYMNAPFLLGRAGGYLLLWSVGGALLAGGCRRLDRLRRARQARPGSGANPAAPGPDERRLAGRLEWMSAPGLLLYVLTSSFAAIDWLLSLDERFYSTIFGLYIDAGQVIAGGALLLLCAAARVRDLERRRASAPPFDRHLLHDLANILLTFVILHAYLAFAQWLIIWYGDKSHEIAWYVPHLAGGWYPLAVALVGLQCLAPFGLLLFRAVKRSPTALLVITAALLGVHQLDLIWMVFPSDPLSAPLPRALCALAAQLAIGGAWGVSFLLLLGARPRAEVSP